MIHYIAIRIRIPSRNILKYNAAYYATFASLFFFKSMTVLSYPNFHNYLTSM